MSESRKFNLSNGPIAPETPGRGGNNVIITNWPKEEAAIICKLVTDPTYRNGTQVYRPANYFTHPTGNKPTDRGRHICRTFFGDKTSPENEKYWETVRALSDLKKAGKSNSDEAKVLKEVLKTFKPSRRGYVLFVRPDSPTIQALRIPESIIDSLTGCKGNDYKEAKTSLIDTMVANGTSPFDLKNETGWLKFWKKGEGVNTEYFVEVAQTVAEAETKDGKKVRYNEPLTAKVHERFFGEVDEKDFPNLIDFEKRYAFTVEESEAFVAAEGSLAGVPARFRKSSVTETTEDDISSYDVETPSVNTEFRRVSEDEIPY